MRDVRGSWQRNLDLQPTPGILIPLQDFGGIFGGPIILNVQGLALSQTADVPLNVGPVGSGVPATFNGAFTPDGSRFNVRFEATAPLCHISGTIEGMKL